MNSANSSTSSWVSVRPPAQPSVSSAKSSSTPGSRSSGQPLMTALVLGRLARVSSAKSLITWPFTQLVVVMPISFT